MSPLAKRVLTGASLAVMAAVVLWLNGVATPGWVPFGAALALSLLGGLECARMGRVRELGATPAFALAALACAAFAAWVLLRLPGMLVPGEAATFALGLYGLALLASLGFVLFEPAPGAPSRPMGVALVLWIVPVLYLWIPLALAFGTAGIVALVVLSKIGDIFGYFVGRAIGRTHPFKKLSPGKTTAGCVASLVAGTVAGALLLPHTLADEASPGAYFAGAGMGALLNIAAQAGDLAESWVKRRAEVKDSSGLVGAAGGVLDVIDSLLLTTPVALLTWPLFA